jgi:hypothetical protein
MGEDLAPGWTRPGGQIQALVRALTAQRRTRAIVRARKPVRTDIGQGTGRIALLAGVELAVAADELVRRRADHTFAVDTNPTRTELILNERVGEFLFRTADGVAEEMAGRVSARTPSWRQRWRQDAFRGFDAEQARRNADDAARLQSELISQVGSIRNGQQPILDAVALQVIERRDPIPRLGDRGAGHRQKPKREGKRKPTKRTIVVHHATPFVSRTTFDLEQTTWFELRTLRSPGAVSITTPEARSKTCDSLFRSVQRSSPSRQNNPTP